MPRNDLRPVEKLVLRCLDPMRTSLELDRIALDYMEAGWDIKRGFAGVVILPLVDGEVHFVPSARGIEQIIFERRA